MTANEQIDIDRVVDYEAEYSAVIEKAKISGDNLTGLCPFHDDRANSFSANLKTGQWKCFSEGEGGNYITFYAKLHNLSTNDAYKEILAKYGISTEPKAKARKEAVPEGPGPYDLKQYSFEKKIPEEFLKKSCKLSTAKDKNGTPYLKIPYLNIAGEETTYRKRFANKNFRWRYGSSGKICLYGEWELERIRQVGYVVLVEGESDTQSLWFMGIPALGVPGADMFKPHQAGVLQDLRVYIHKEPDAGGDVFLQKVCNGLREGGFLGEAYVWSCDRFKLKDPSELLIKRGKDEAGKLIKQSLRSAKKVDLDHEQIPEAVSGAPIRLRQPEHWRISEHGISKIVKAEVDPVVICRTPILLTRRLKNTQTDEEKIEVAFKRDGRWIHTTAPRTLIFTSRSITELANLGCTITSENAKDVVRYLEALEAENFDIIPVAEATSTLGWQPAKRFYPGFSGDLVLDVDQSCKNIVSAYSQGGTYEKWLEIMAPHRESDIFRFILAASFAAPLLRVVNQRIFFVHNWGGSRGGKTAALKAALSAWGDPERLMTSFNATQVGLERIASLYCDLPLGIDERQLAGTKQDLLEKIVYMIASGSGKIRGTKSGGVQAPSQWRTVALSTGEEPISTESSQTGVSTRVLEIYGAPFTDQRDAGLMHQLTSNNFGWAGPAFIKRLVTMSEPTICDAHEEMMNHVSSVSAGKNMAHIAGISTVALADAMIDSWLFHAADSDADDSAELACLSALGIRKESWRRAMVMADNLMQAQIESNEQDVNENATQFIVDWILSNRAYFNASSPGSRLGFFDDNKGSVYIFQSALVRVLKEEKFSSRKTMKYLAEQGLITTTTEDDGKTRYSVSKWFEGRSAWFVEFHLEKLSTQQSDAGEDKEPTVRYEQQSISGSVFSELEAGDEELPF